MFRFLVTGACTVIMTGAGFSVSLPVQLKRRFPGAVTVATAAADPGADELQAQSIRAAAVEVAAPTAGADLAMWGVNPATEPAPAGDESRLTGSRLVRRFADGILHRSAALAVNLTRNAMRFLGVPYAFGGTSSSGFDCSGYVQHVFAMLGLPPPAGTADATVRRRQAGQRCGDGTRRSGVLSNVRFGSIARRIYLGNDRLVHASSSHGVTVSEPPRGVLVGPLSGSKTADLGLLDVVAGAAGHCRS